MQQRTANQKMIGNSMKHADGMSSDDEMSSLDQATLGKVRQDVENQARTGKNPILFFTSVSKYNSTLFVTHLPIQK